MRRISGGEWYLRLFMLNRAMSLLLCWIFLAAALPASVKTDTPICCLRDGSHHCMGAMADSENGPTARAENACPYQKQLKSALQSPAVLSLADAAGGNGLSSLVAIAHRVLRLAAPSIRPISRGPPLVS